MKFEFIKNSEAKTLTYNLSTNEIIPLLKIYQLIENNLRDQPIVRVCVHLSQEETTQMMFIGLREDYKMKFHKNCIKEKIYIVLKGKLLFEMKDRKMCLEAGELFKLSKNTFAKMTSETSYSIYEEVIAGPFDNEDTIYE